MGNFQLKKILSNIVKQHHLEGQFLYDGLAFQADSSLNVDLLVHLGALSLIRSDTRHSIYRVGDNPVLLSQYL